MKFSIPRSQITFDLGVSGMDLRIADACFTWRGNRTEDSFRGFFQELSSRDRHGWPEVHVQRHVANYLKSSQRARRGYIQILDRFTS